MFRWLKKLWRSLNAPPPLPDTLRREYYKQAQRAALEYHDRALRKRDATVGADQHLLQRRAELELIQRRAQRREELH